MSRVASLFAWCAIGVAVSQAATITAGSAGSSKAGGSLVLASQQFSLSGPGFTFTGSGISDNGGPCTLSCGLGSTLRGSSIGNGPDGGISGNLTLNGVSQDYSFGPLSSGGVFISFSFDLVVPSINPLPPNCFNCSLVLTGPFTADALYHTGSTPLFEALGGGTASVTLLPLPPAQFVFVGQTFTFVPTPEAPPFLSLAAALFGLLAARLFAPLLSVHTQREKP